MKSLFAAEFAILSQFNSVRIVLLVLHCVVVSLLAFGACQDDFVSHDRFLLVAIYRCWKTLFTSKSEQLLSHRSVCFSIKSLNNITLWVRQCQLLFCSSENLFAIRSVVSFHLHSFQSPKCPIETILSRSTAFHLSGDTIFVVE